jgi:DNA repair exonuclease SbcCD ATPase subunit
LEIFEKAQARAKTEYDEIRHKIETGEHDVEFLRERLSKIPVVEKEFGTAQGEVKVLSESLGEVNKKILTEEERLRDLERKHEAFISAKASLEEKEKRISGIEKEMENIVKAGDEANELREAVKRLEDETKDHERSVEELAKLKEIGHLAAGLEKEARVHTKSLEEAQRTFRLERSKLNERLNVAEGRIAALSTTIDKDEAFRLLRTEGALEERISRIEMEIEWLTGREDVINQIQRDREDAVQHMEDVSGKVHEINEDSFVLTEIENQVDQIRKDLKAQQERHETRVREMETTREGVGREIKKLGFDDEAKKRLEVLEETIADMGTKKDRLRDSRRKLDEIGEVGKLLEDLKKRLIRGQKEVKDLGRQQKKLASDEDKYRHTRRDVEELKKGKSETEKELRGKEVLIESLQKRLAELEGERHAMEEKGKVLDESRSNLEIRAILKDQIFHKKGVAMYAINQLLPELEIETSQNLIDLTDGRFTRVSLKTHEAKREYGVKFEVEGVDGDWHDVAEFSGGERTQINAALRFAIAKQLAGLPQVGRTFGRMKTLFIDEGDLGSLDTESNRDLFIHKLFKMGEFFDRVVLITHLGEVADKFPGKVRVHMTQEQESRIEVVS